MVQVEDQEYGHAVRSLQQTSSDLIRIVKGDIPLTDEVIKSVRATARGYSQQFGSNLYEKMSSNLTAVLTEEDLKEFNIKP